jgi:hypothetical protein
MSTETKDRGTCAKIPESLPSLSISTLPLTGRGLQGWPAARNQGKMGGATLEFLSVLSAGCFTFLSLSAQDFSMGTQPSQAMVYFNFQNRSSDL